MNNYQYDHSQINQQNKQIYQFNNPNYFQNQFNPNFQYQQNFTTQKSTNQILNNKAYLSLIDVKFKSELNMLGTDKMKEYENFSQKLNDLWSYTFNNDYIEKSNENINTLNQYKKKYDKNFKNQENFEKFRKFVENFQRNINMKGISKVSQEFSIKNTDLMNFFNENKYFLVKQIIEIKSTLIPQNLKGKIQDFLRAKEKNIDKLSVSIYPEQPKVQKKNEFTLFSNTPGALEDTDELSKKETLIKKIQQKINSGLIRILKFSESIQKEFLFHLKTEIPIVIVNYYLGLSNNIEDSIKHYFRDYNGTDRFTLLFVLENFNEIPFEFEHSERCEVLFQKLELLFLNDCRIFYKNIEIEKSDKTFRRYLGSYYFEDHARIYIKE